MKSISNKRMLTIVIIVLMTGFAVTLAMSLLIALFPLPVPGTVKTVLFVMLGSAAVMLAGVAVWVIRTDRAGGFRISKTIKAEEEEKTCSGSGEE